MTREQQQPGPSPKRLPSRAGGSASRCCGRELLAPAPGRVAVPMWMGSAKGPPHFCSNVGASWASKSPGNRKVQDGEVLGARGGAVGGTELPSPSTDTRETSKWRPAAVRRAEDQRIHRSPSPTRPSIKPRRGADSRSCSQSHVVLASLTPTAPFLAPPRAIPAPPFVLATPLAGADDPRVPSPAQQWHAQRRLWGFLGD